MGVNIKFNSALKNLINMDFGETNVFIKFGTEWCVPCQELDKILVNFPNSMLYHVNLDNDEIQKRPSKFRRCYDSRQNK